MTNTECVTNIIMFRVIKLCNDERMCKTVIIGSVSMTGNTKVSNNGMKNTSGLCEKHDSRGN